MYQVAVHQSHSSREAATRTTAAAAAAAVVAFDQASVAVVETSAALGGSLDAMAGHSVGFARLADECCRSDQKRRPVQNFQAAE